jgi:hypothetical protein
VIRGPARNLIWGKNMNKLPSFIGLKGAIGSGKDTCATYLCHFFGYSMIGFSDPVYESLYRLNPAIVIAHHRAVYLQTLVNKHGWDIAKRRYPEIRAMLRTIGTENGRNLFGPYCWVNIAKQRVKEMNAPRVVFRDVRFPEEAEYIYANGGEIWEIEGRVSDEVALLPQHSSEQQLFTISRKILNDGSLPQFHRRINEVMKTYLPEEE